MKAATLLLPILVSLALNSCGEEPAKPTTPPKPKEFSLFDGKSLAGWKEIDYAGKASVEVVDGEIRVGQGEVLTGVVLADKPPLTINYEISLDAMKIDGSDFFCALTFPINDKHCTMVVGGWGGGLVGISSIDHMDASENSTQVIRSFESKKWYKIRLRVTESKFEGWIDDKKLIDFDHKGRALSMRVGDIEQSVPLGLSTFQTKAAYKNIIMKAVPAEEAKP